MDVHTPIEKQGRKQKRAEFSKIHWVFCFLFLGIGCRSDKTPPMKNPSQDTSILKRFLNLDTFGIVHCNFYIEEKPLSRFPPGPSSNYEMVAFVKSANPHLFQFVRKCEKMQDSIPWAISSVDLVMAGKKYPWGYQNQNYIFKSDIYKVNVLCRYASLKGYVLPLAENEFLFFVLSEN
jgi:hypothetical protein